MYLIQDTVTGFLLAGIGHRTVDGQNFLIVKQGLLCEYMCHNTAYFLETD